MAATLFEDIQEMLANDEDISEHLLAFDPQDSDRAYVAQVTAGVRGLLGRPELTPLQVVSLARLLLGLGRLPLLTPGLDVSVTAAPAAGERWPTWELALNEYRLSLRRGEGEPFEVDPQERSDTEPAEMAWLPDLAELAAGRELTIEDYSESDKLDWAHPDGAALWDHLPQLVEEDEA